ncbi:hypothetical protein HYC85_002199 [Camellia sinensis]|uniref:Jasmonate O-methyltransferase n=1 Tax=Camellia sinensis TaxID=4442 RepID=A0A7J7I7J3_CAMSI|nr:hypothetical protein HYC85_002199 [Camellia sinensis]
MDKSLRNIIGRRRRKGPKQKNLLFKRGIKVSFELKTQRTPSFLLTTTMDVEKVFHMTGGAGDSSYAKNSSLQKKGSDMVKHITMGAIQQLYLTTSPKSIGIADLGCSSGTNSLSTIREMVDAIEETNRSKVSQPLPEFRVYLNDLPTNDFNAVFKALPDFYRELKQARIDQGSGPSIYIAGYPGSFYGRLFPTDCLHFIYSSYSLHWLSRVPPALYDEQGMSINKGNIYISESSPPEVSEAYFRQFQEDFSLFLRSRSEELIAGGRMVLILLGRIGSNHVDRGNSLLWKLLTQSLTILVSQEGKRERWHWSEGKRVRAVVVVDKSGVAVRAEKRRGSCNCGWGREKGWLEVTRREKLGKVEKDRLDSYEAHFYAPSKEELEDETRREGSFEMDRLEMVEMGRDVEDSKSYGMAVAKAVRAIQESMISHHFGEGIVDSLFQQYERLVVEEMAREEMITVSFVIVLGKK